MNLTTKLLISILFLAITSNQLLAQNNKISAGITVEFSVEQPSGTNLFGIQGKYEISSKQGLQAQLGLGTNNFFFAGADYLYNILPMNNMPKLFVGGGIGYESIRGTKINDLVLSSQAGVKFDIGRISPYLAYKRKFYLQAEGFDASVILFGVRYKFK